MFVEHFNAFFLEPQVSSLKPLLIPGTMAIVPLGLNRISVPLQANRAYYNLQSSQTQVSNLEEQLQSQRQYRYGSDSPYNASTTLTVQAQMERKAQNASNLKSTQNYLTATDSTLGQFSALTDDVRGLALDAINTYTSDTQRASLAKTTSQAIQQIFSFANNSYQGRYLFAGSTTSVIPFEWGTDSYTVDYRGTEHNVYSWSDTDLLSQSNINGVEAFGAISDPVRGQVDLDPSLSGSTLLSNLNGGKGIEKGMIRLTYAVEDRVYDVDIDLSNCVTLTDVERAIENNKNPYFSVEVDLTRDGLVLSLPQDTHGTVQVSEIGKGTTAMSLGIPTNVSFGQGDSLVGRDLNPSLTTTTPLNDILGSRAGVSLRFAGQNNDLEIVARHNGEAWTDEQGQVWPLNDLTVAIQADTDVSPGEEYVQFDPESQRLVIHIHPDNTTADNVIQAFQRANDEGTIPPFDAVLSGTDQVRADAGGTGVISYLPGIQVELGQTGGGSGTDFDSSGFQIVNGNTTHEISLDQCRTVGDLLAELNDPKYGLYATINDSNNGIDIRSRVSGADFCIGENGGNTATQLGLRTSALDTRLEDFDFGRGVSDYTGPGTAATASYSSTTPNSSLILRCRDEGSQWNGYALRFVPTTDPQGEVLVSMNEEEKVIEIGINVGTTTACEVVEAFNSQPGPKQYFELELDTTDGLNSGLGVVYDGQAVTSGGSDGGIDFTITRNDGTVLEIDIHGAETLGEVLDRINAHTANADGLLVASLAKNGNGIELTDKSFGECATRVDRTLLSTTAVELGLIPQGEEYRTKTTDGERATLAIDFGADNSALLISARSVGTYANDVTVEVIEGTAPGFLWDAASGTLQFTVLPGVTTANELVELFRDQAPETVRAMFEVQNGTNPDGSTSSGAGLVAPTTGTLVGGTDSVLTGDDPNPQETESLFNALIRLQVAMEKNDTREIERATQLLDGAVERLNASRATVGVMQNSLDNVQERLSEEYVQHEATLNQTLRIDYADASISYMAQMLSYQASLQITSSLFQMSLLNYI